MTRLGCVALVFFACFGSGSLAAEPSIDVKKAAQIKAAYLRYIAEFTTWPDDALGESGAPIILGAIGTDPHGVIKILEGAIKGKGLFAQKRRIELRRLPEPDDAAFEAALEGCHLLFLTGNEGGVAGWRQMREVIANRPIVTVGEISGFSTASGMIEFVIDPADSRVTMHIDLQAVSSAGLRLSSHLLGLKQGVKIVRTPLATDACPRGMCADVRRSGLAPTGSGTSVVSLGRSSIDRGVRR